MEQNMDSAIEHFEPRFDNAAIQDAIQRLTQTRFPDAETVEDWQQGVPQLLPGTGPLLARGVRLATRTLTAQSVRQLHH